MPVEVILPKVDMDMATGQIVRWFVAEGAAVKKGEALFEIETDKAAMEIDAPASGILREVTGGERVDIPVGQAVAWIYAEGEDADRANESAASQRHDSPSPPARPFPRKNGEKEVDRNADAPHSLASEGQQQGPVRATPLARRLARAAGLDLTHLAGSGPNGRILRADVEAAVSDEANSHELASSISPSADAPQPLSPPLDREGRATVSEFPSPLREGVKGVGGPHNGPSADPILNLFPAGSYILTPHDNMRKTIARRLTDAKQTVPHFYLTLDCAIDALLALRAELNAAAPLRDGQPAYKLSVNDMVVKAWAMALAQVPDANASWTEKNLVRHAHVDVGIAVSVPGGLITPIVRKADAKSLSAISAEAEDFAARAKTKKLRPDEYQGGTTSVSNLGMFGVRDFAAIVNPPQATILAVGAGEQRAIVRNGAVVAATMMSVTLSVDHRAVDGALAAELLAVFRKIVERPLSMLV